MATKTAECCQTHSPDVALAFKHVSVSNLYPPKPLLRNISGFVVRGGVTAVLGGSSSGKSLLMKTLAGRVQDLDVSGEVYLHGTRVEVKDVMNDIGYVPQTDTTIGDLTTREMLMTNALLKLAKPQSEIQSHVDRVIADIGLSHVANNPIGTIFKRGLSGGQKKRVDFGNELSAASSVLLIDEVTSGLDGSIAFDVLSAIKRIASESKGRLSVIVSIHQPNARILSLFDHILLLADGQQTFFGTVPNAIAHFTSIGFQPPCHVTVTDYFLQVTDATFSDHVDFDFTGAYVSSPLSERLVQFIDDVRRKGNVHASAAAHMKRTSAKSLRHVDAAERDVEAATASTGGAGDAMQQITVGDAAANTPKKMAVMSAKQRTETTFWRQYTTLLRRDFILASRDPALYYLQFLLVCMFGFLVGAAFFQLKYRVDDTMSYVPGGVLWIVMMCSYIHTFAVFHMSTQNKRFEHERSNNSYTVLAAWSADVTSTSIMLLLYVGGSAIAYFMMGLPAKQFPFLIAVFWMTAMTAQSMLGLITKFFDDATAAVVACQGALVIFTVFGGGAFITWDETPDYWVWLQEISLFTQASRAAILQVMDEVTFDCTLMSTGGSCVGPTGAVYPCNSVVGGSDMTCKVDGRDIMYVDQGVGTEESPAKYLGILIAIFAFCRLAQLLFMYYPVKRVMFNIRNYMFGPLVREVIASGNRLSRVEGQLRSFMSRSRGKYDGSAEAHHEAHHAADMTPLVYEDATNDAIAELGVAGDVEKMHRPNNNASADDADRSDGLTWTNLSVILPATGAKLIDNVTGGVKRGRVLALMGPSGAGKTTLLNALANRAPYARVEGDIRFCGRAVQPSDIMYVPQFDELNPQLTVSEQIELVGRLTCIEQHDMVERVSTLLRVLGLYSKRDIKCGALSGGELKRVSIAIKVIGKPNILFLDEPSTGLDSTAAFALAKLTVDLARETNVSIIMTIHQPAAIVFYMLQDLMLLEGGRLAYYGPLVHARAYFASMGYNCPEDANPADFYLDLIYKAPAHAPSSTWRDVFLARPEGQALSRQSTMNVRADSSLPPSRPSTLSRMVTVINYFITYYWRETGIYPLRMLFLVLIGFFIGTLFLDLQTNTSQLTQYGGIIFFAIWSSLFSAVAATGHIANERRQAVEQVKNGILFPGFYTIAQFTASLPFNFACALVFQSIVHWLSNINPSGEVFAYAIVVTWGHLLLMEAIMMLVVQGLKDAMLSVTFAMVVLGALFLFSGFFVKVSAIPPAVRWICYIMPTKYSFDGYVRKIFLNQTFDIDAIPGATMTGSELLSQVFKQDEDLNAWSMIAVLLGWIVFFRVAHYAMFSWELLPFITTRGAQNAPAPHAQSEPVLSTATDGVHRAVAEVEMQQSSMAKTTV